MGKDQASCRFPFPSLATTNGRLRTELERRVGSDRGNFWRMASWNHGAAMALIDLADALRDDARIPRRLRELVILRTSQLCGAALPVHHHQDMARAAGVEESIVQAAETGNAEGLDEPCRLTLRIVDSLVMNKRAEPEALSALARLLGEAAAMDIMLLSGFYITVSLTMNSCGIIDEGKGEGGIPWL